MERIELNRYISGDVDGDIAEIIHPSILKLYIERMWKGDYIVANLDGEKYIFDIEESKVYIARSRQHGRWIYTPTTYILLDGYANYLELDRSNYESIYTELSSRIKTLDDILRLSNYSGYTTPAHYIKKYLLKLLYSSRIYPEIIRIYVEPVETSIYPEKLHIYLDKETRIGELAIYTLHRRLTQNITFYVRRQQATYRYIPIYEVKGVLETDT